MSPGIGLTSNRTHGVATGDIDNMAGDRSVSHQLWINQLFLNNRTEPPTFRARGRAIRVEHPGIVSRFDARWADLTWALIDLGIDDRVSVVSAATYYAEPSSTCGSGPLYRNRGRIVADSRQGSVGVNPARTGVVAADFNATGGLS